MPLQKFTYVHMGAGLCALPARANNLTDYPTVAAALSAEQNKYRAVWKCRRLLGTFPPALHPSHLHGPARCSPATITLIGCSKRAGKCSGCSYLSSESLKGSVQDVPSKRQWQRFFTQNRGLLLWTVPVHLEVLFPPQHCSQKKAFSLPGAPVRPLCSTWLAVIHQPG